jgi:hypothetical protein
MHQKYIRSKGVMTLRSGSSTLLAAPWHSGITPKIWALDTVGLLLVYISRFWVHQGRGSMQAHWRTAFTFLIWVQACLYQGKERGKRGSLLLLLCFCYCGYLAMSSCQQLSASVFALWLNVSGHGCGERIMRILWKLNISTVMLNNLQAEFGTTTAAEGAKGKMQHSCFS